MTKQEIIKMNSKIQLIKSKCMNVKPRIGKSDSKRTLNSVWMANQQLNQSVDLDSEDAKESRKATKVHLLKSVFDDRPPTVFFKYPKCCGIEDIESDRVFSIDKVQLTYKIVGSEYKCIVNSL